MTSLTCTVYCAAASLACTVCCAVANQQQQLDDWCSRQLPTSTTTDTEQSLSAAGEDHRSVGLLAGHDHASSVEVSVWSLPCQHTHSHTQRGITGWTRPDQLSGGLDHVNTHTHTQRGITGWT